MTTFTVTIKRILAIEPHPNADAIEFALIDGYRSIVKKGHFVAGNLVAYIPEAALLPVWLLQELNLWDAEKDCGKLTGKAGNRVKAIKLRGELSQGLCLAGTQDSSVTGAIKTGTEFGCFALVREGDDVAGILGITKYEPPIPTVMAGEVFNAGTELTLSYDVENLKAYPNAFTEGEEVVITEKLHGTCTVVAILPLKDAHPEAFGKNKNILVFSKGLGAKGLVLKNNEKNANNLYVRATCKLIEAIDKITFEADSPFFLLGETFGPGVQDLSYGKEIGMRLFACAEGYRGKQSYYSWTKLEIAAHIYNQETVPVLYRGPYSANVVQEHTNGKTTLGANHIREGVVIVPADERIVPNLGRLCLKSVSEDYLLRKNATEFN